MKDFVGEHLRQEASRRPVPNLFFAVSVTRQSWATHRGEGVGFGYFACDDRPGGLGQGFTAPRCCECLSTR